MNRQTAIKNLVGNLETLGRSMAGRRILPTKGMPTPAQIGILFHLSHRGSQGIKQLAVICGMTSSAVTQLVDPLVKDGLIVRVPDKNDRRMICVNLTAKGRAKLAQAKKMRIKMFVNFLKPLTEAELIQLGNIQAKIFSHMQSLWNQPRKK